MKKGFTLMELLIVMVIVTVLMTIALPKYKGAAERGRGLEALANAEAIAETQNALYLRNGSYYLDGSKGSLDNTKKTAADTEVLRIAPITSGKFFTDASDIQSPATAYARVTRRGLSDAKTYYIFVVSQGGEVAQRTCCGYERYCKLLGASTAVNNCSNGSSSNGNGWKF